MINIRPSISGALAKREVDHSVHGKYLSPDISQPNPDTGGLQMNSTDRWAVAPDFDTGTAEDLEKYGITRVPADYFLYGGYRYTNLADAIAAARRAQKGV